MKKLGTALAAVLLVMIWSIPAARAAEADKPQRLVLSVSWQAGYCAARPKSKACAGFDPASPAARQFTLYSLYVPRKSYCGVAPELKEKARKGKWTALPETALPAALRTRLDAAMPATKLGLDRQQWLRSGLCVATSAEAYYDRALALLDALNGSKLAALFSGKAGGAVTLDEVRASVDDAFGKGSGERVRFSCRKAGDKTVVIGLTLALAGAGKDLAPLLMAASPSSSRCTEGQTGKP